jgi:uncharacterized protein HemY
MESFRKLETVSPLGASMAASGLGDLALYEGHFSDAVQILESGAAADSASGRNADSKLTELAYAHISLGHKKPAIDAAERGPWRTARASASAS